MQKRETPLTTAAKRQGRAANQSAPFCVECRGRMLQRTRGPRGKRWLCEPCNFSIYQQTSGMMRGAVRSEINNPHCLKCRKPMAKHSKGIWKCKPCKWYANAHCMQASPKPRARTLSGRLRTASGRVRRKKNCRLPFNPAHPWCVHCHFQMKQNGPRNKKRWECHLCGASCATFQAAPGSQLVQNNNDSGVDLITFIDSKLTGYSVEMREELGGEIAIALLSRTKIGGGPLTRASLTPATVRLIAKPIYKMQPNRFRDISLDHTYGEDGHRLEERLVG